ncbi:hypothetical protein BTUL_0043g00650 [Botrytis tulipae]|uniref:Uncharacterized protein n=1 Tax=Botrytis tulipae TaxID=87230 RepID=A0A4Z1EUS8_9HELO|nr:hypothetical protein BTUL_0043g00650 [Botrytis tulipae]
MRIWRPSSWLLWCWKDRKKLLRHNAGGATSLLAHKVGNTLLHKSLNDIFSIAPAGVEHQAKT